MEISGVASWSAITRAWGKFVNQYVTNNPKDVYKQDRLLSMIDVPKYRVSVVVVLVIVILLTVFSHSSYESPRKSANTLEFARAVGLESVLVACIYLLRITSLRSLSWQHGVL